MNAMRKAITALLAFASLCAVSLPATAQVQCNATETFRACFNRIANGPLEETTAEASEAVAAMKLNTWHFAKRQLTWFKKDKAIRWVSDAREAEVAAAEF